MEKREGFYTPGVGFGSDVPGPRRNLIRIYANAVAYALLLFLMLQNVASRMIAVMLRPFYPSLRIYNDSLLASSELIEQINITGALICYLIPCLMLAAALRMPLKRVCPLKRVPTGTLLCAIGVTLGSSALGSGVSTLLTSAFQLIGLEPSGPSIPDADTLGLLLLTIVSTAVVPAVCEEVLFRGVIMQSLRRFGDLFALFTSALLFALLHRNFVQLPNALITGTVLGFLMLQTGSLHVVIVCHLVNNLIPVVLQSVMAVFPAVSDTLVMLVLNVCYISAGLGGIIGWSVNRMGESRSLRGDGRQRERWKYRSLFSSLPMLTLVLVLTTMIMTNLLF